MAALRGKGDGAGDTAPSLIAMSIALKVSDGALDEYLRVLYTSVVERKKLLEASGTLPDQQSLSIKEFGSLGLEELSQVHNALSESPVALAAAQPTSTSPRKPRPIITKVPRPDPSTAPFEGKISPITTQEKDSLGEEKVIGINGLVYRRSDFLDKCVQVGPMLGVDDLRLKIIGIGQKAVKVVIVNEPPHGLVYQKRNLHEVWSSNDFMFTMHDIVVPWLVRPSI